MSEKLSGKKRLSREEEPAASAASEGKGEKKAVKAVKADVKEGKPASGTVPKNTEAKSAAAAGEKKEKAAKGGAGGPSPAASGGSSSGAVKKAKTAMDLDIDAMFAEIKVKKQEIKVQEQRKEEKLKVRKVGGWCQTLNFFGIPHALLPHPLPRTLLLLSSPMCRRKRRRRPRQLRA